MLIQDKSKMLARQLHCHAVSLNNKSGGDAASLAKRLAQDPEVDTTLRLFLGSAGHAGLELEGVRVSKTRRGRLDGYEMAAVLLKEGEARMELRTFLAMGSGEDYFDFDLRPFRSFPSALPLTDGLGMLRLDEHKGEIHFEDGDGLVRVRFNAESMRFSISYGGPFRDVSFFHEVPIAFCKAMEAKIQDGAIPARLSVAFVHGLHALASNS